MMQTVTDREDTRLRPVPIPTALSRAALCLAAAAVLLPLTACGDGNPTTPHAPKTIHVPADQPTIAAAAASVAPGDSILVAPGRYAEASFSLYPGVVLVGEGGPDSVVVDGAGACSLHLTWQPERTTTDSTVIRGVTFRRLALVQVQGLASVRRCRFVACGRSAATAGVEVSGGGEALFAGCTFDSCDVHANLAHGGGLHGAGTVTLIGCSFRGNGSPVSFGAGAYLEGPSTLVGCLFTANSALSAGGALVLDGPGPFSLSGCNFIDNSAGYEGGAVLCEEGAATLTGCTFTGNGGYAGGALYCSAPTMVVSCLFSDNEAEDRGGAVAIDGGAPEFVGCNLTGNRARKGGACWSQDAQPTFTGCTLGANEAGGGGGVYLATGRLALTSCTLAGNRAEGYGGAAFQLGMASPCSLAVTASTVTANQAGIAAGGFMVATGGSLLEGTASTILDNQAPAAPDGSVGDLSAAVLTCCEIDTLQWDAPGRLTVHDEDCGPARAPGTVETARPRRP